MRDRYIPCISPDMLVEVDVENTLVRGLVELGQVRLRCLSVYHFVILTRRFAISAAVNER